MDSKKSMRKISFTCPICGQGTDRPVEELTEGALLVCPFCNLSLTLHGHMWQEVKDQIDKLDT